MESNPTTTAKAAFCSACGTRLSDGARFCHKCGAAGGETPTARSAAGALPWTVAALALIALISLLAGQFFGKRQGSESAAAPPAAAPGGGMRAPDISSMSPQERADRLFDRVMTYVSANLPDSAQFFAPMAIASQEALTPRTAHVRYDLGLLGFVTNNGAMAAAEADTILVQQPTHLLGLVLAARVADARSETAKRDALEKRLIAAEKSEIAKGLTEYAEHANDIQTAIATAKGRKP